MPQMAPMNWLSMYLVFSTLFLLMMVISFFQLNYKNNPFKSNKQSIKPSWKW
uniref:ATP synthase complex subunit 8 n=1 Tax=Scolytinae sp. BMNH 1040327 TaxID=1903790 RepID=A0A343A644_9CUCU|nr:ATP synthase F0 subunit 8 [Scolytinae sp. BMNH 1040327]